MPVKETPCTLFCSRLAGLHLYRGVRLPAQPAHRCAECAWRHREAHVISRHRPGHLVLPAVAANTDLLILPTGDPDATLPMLPPHHGLTQPESAGAADPGGADVPAADPRELRRCRTFYVDEPGSSDLRAAFAIDGRDYTPARSGSAPTSPRRSPSCTTAGCPPVHHQPR